MNTSRHFFHACSKGLESFSLFTCEADYIAGMNRIAFCRLAVPGIIVLAFTLMENHLHVILYGTYEECLDFMKKYKHLTSIYIASQRRETGFLGRMIADAWILPNQDSLMEKTAYVFRNPVAANMSFTPFGYRWSSAWLQFADLSWYETNLKQVSLLSMRGRREMFLTRMDIPSIWRFYENGMIWPGDYTDYKRIDKLFGRPESLMFRLNTKVEASVNMEMNAGSLALPPEELRSVRNALLSEMFGSRSVEELNTSERMRLAVKLKKETRSSCKSLARLVHIPLEDLKKVFGN